MHLGSTIEKGCSQREETCKEVEARVWGTRFVLLDTEPCRQGCWPQGTFPTGLDRAQGLTNMVEGRPCVWNDTVTFYQGSCHFLSPVCSARLARIWLKATVPPATSSIFWKTTTSARKMKNWPESQGFFRQDCQLLFLSEPLQEIRELILVSGEKAGPSINGRRSGEPSGVFY